jgi:hypothetical protein
MTWLKTIERYDWSSVVKTTRNGSVAVEKVGAVAKTSRKRHLIETISDDLVADGAVEPLADLDEREIRLIKRQKRREEKGVKTSRRADGTQGIKMVARGVDGIEEVVVEAATVDEENVEVVEVVEGGRVEAAEVIENGEVIEREEDRIEDAAIGEDRVSAESKFAIRVLMEAVGLEKMKEAYGTVSDLYLKKRNVEMRHSLSTSDITDSIEFTTYRKALVELLHALDDLEIPERNECVKKVSAQMEHLDAFRERLMLLRKDRFTLGVAREYSVEARKRQNGL